MNRFRLDTRAAIYLSCGLLLGFTIAWLLLQRQMKIIVAQAMDCQPRELTAARRGL